uniref:Uncharacterized protein n=1 Tax=Nelumbo nucifera TaxID=4432 RepID=A0A822YUI9_NELNU|nr:TPA_asm: hypothetical protein HUJ06_011759 [Nelumbo nucifera]
MLHSPCEGPSNPRQIHICPSNPSGDGKTRRVHFNVE